MTNEEKAKRDLRQEITNQVIEMLEKGTAPWVRPWRLGELTGMLNATTNNHYQGINVCILQMAIRRSKQKDPRWMTYLQAQSKGWQVRKGEKGTKILVYLPPRKILNKHDELEEKNMVVVWPTVFNVTQVVGDIPAYEPAKVTVFTAATAGEAIMKKSGAKIAYSGSEAYYTPLLDQITIPDRKKFKDAAGFYETAMHELVHWTGHKTRLDRHGITGRSVFGSVEYAREELVAELGAFFICAETGLPFNPKNSGAYIQHWVRLLKRDKKEIFKAASQAARAADFLLNRTKTKVSVKDTSAVVQKKAA